MTEQEINKNSTTFDNKVISEDDLEVTDDGDDALSVIEKGEAGINRILILPLRDKSGDYTDIFETVKKLTGSSEHTISKVQFQLEADESLIFKIAEDETPEEDSSAQELANYLVSNAEC